MGSSSLAALLAVIALLVAASAADSTTVPDTTTTSTDDWTTTTTAPGPVLGTGAIVGISVGAAALVALVFLLIIFRKKLCCSAAAPSRPIYSQKQGLTNKRDPYPSESQIAQQFNELDGTIVSNHTQSIGNRDENISKNRYPDIIPYDYNRVKLNNNNYINASIIEEMFIATQDLLLTDDKDFWPMVVQQHVFIIVRLSTDPENVATDNDENQPRCAVYLPDKKWEFEDRLSVEFDGTEKKANFTTTIFKTQWHDKKATVHHYHIHGWEKERFPEPRVTLGTITTIKQKWNELGKKGKVLVHCGAGTGRTGTFIALWLLHDQLIKNIQTSVLDVCKKLRQQRPGMVTQETMFAYLHKCVKEYEESGGYDHA